MIVCALHGGAPLSAPDAATAVTCSSAMHVYCAACVHQLLARAVQPSAPRVFHIACAAAPDAGTTCSLDTARVMSAADVPLRMALMRALTAHDAVPPATSDSPHDRFARAHADTARRGVLTPTWVEEWTRHAGCVTAVLFALEARCPSCDAPAPPPLPPTDVLLDAEAPPDELVVTCSACASIYCAFCLRKCGARALAHVHMEHGDPGMRTYAALETRRAALAAERVARVLSRDMRHPVLVWACVVAAADHMQARGVELAALCVQQRVQPYAFACAQAHADAVATLRLSCTTPAHVVALWPVLHMFGSDGGAVGDLMLGHLNGSAAVAHAWASLATRIAALTHTGTALVHRVLPVARWTQMMIAAAAHELFVADVPVCDTADAAARDDACLADLECAFREAAPGRDARILTCMAALCAVMCAAMRRAEQLPDDTRTQMQRFVRACVACEVGALRMFCAHVYACTAATAHFAHTLPLLRARRHVVARFLLRRITEDARRRSTETLLSTLHVLVGDTFLRIDSTQAWKLTTDLDDTTRVLMESDVHMDARTASAWIDGCFALVRLGNVAFDAPHVDERAHDEEAATRLCAQRAMQQLGAFVGRHLTVMLTANVCGTMAVLTEAGEGMTALLTAVCLAHGSRFGIATSERPVLDAFAEAVVFAASPRRADEATAVMDFVHELHAFAQPLLAREHACRGVQTLLRFLVTALPCLPNVDSTLCALASMHAPDFYSVCVHTLLWPVCTSADAADDDDDDAEHIAAAVAAQSVVGPVDACIGRASDTAMHDAPCDEAPAYHAWQLQAGLTGVLVGPDALAPAMTRLLHHLRTSPSAVLTPDTCHELIYLIGTCLAVAAMTPAQPALLRAHAQLPTYLWALVKQALLDPGMDAPDALPGVLAWQFDMLIPAADALDADALDVSHATHRLLVTLLDRALLLAHALGAGTAHACFVVTNIAGTDVQARALHLCVRRRLSLTHMAVLARARMLNAAHLSPDVFAAYTDALDAAVGVDSPAWFAHQFMLDELRGGAAWRAPAQLHALMRAARPCAPRNAHARVVTRTAQPDLAWFAQTAYTLRLSMLACARTCACTLPAFVTSPAGAAAPAWVQCADDGTLDTRLLAHPAQTHDTVYSALYLYVDALVQWCAQHNAPVPTWVRTHTSWMASLQRVLPYVTTTRLLYWRGVLVALVPLWRAHDGALARAWTRFWEPRADAAVHVAPFVVQLLQCQTTPATHAVVELALDALPRFENVRMAVHTAQAAIDTTRAWTGRTQHVLTSALMAAWPRATGVAAVEASLLCEMYDRVTALACASTRHWPGAACLLRLFAHTAASNRLYAEHAMCTYDAVMLPDARAMMAHAPQSVCDLAHLWHAAPLVGSARDMRALLQRRIVFLRRAAAACPRALRATLEPQLTACAASLVRKRADDAADDADDSSADEMSDGDMQCAEDTDCAAECINGKNNEHTVYALCGTIGKNNEHTVATTQNADTASNANTAHTPDPPSSGMPTNERVCTRR